MCDGQEDWHTTLAFCRAMWDTFDTQQDEPFEPISATYDATGDESVLGCCFDPSGGGDVRFTEYAAGCETFCGGILAGDAFCYCGALSPPIPPPPPDEGELPPPAVSPTPTPPPADAHAAANAAANAATVAAAAGRRVRMPRWKRVVRRSGEHRLRLAVFHLLRVLRKCAARPAVGSMLV